MEDLVKKIVYTSVGFVSNTTEIVQKAIDEIVKKGNVSEEDGKSIVENLVGDTNIKREELEVKLRGMVDNALSKVTLPTRENFEILVNRVEELEAKLAEATKTKTRKPRKTTTKAKATTKTTTKTTAKKAPETVVK